MTIRRQLACVIALLAALVLGAAPAAAGGPTSVLVVDPGTGQAAGLHYTGPDYDRLADLVGAFANGTSGGGRPADADAGSVVLLTWLIHDVQVWRVDEVHVGATGATWIDTRTSVDGSGNLWDAPVYGHAPQDGAALAALLDDVLLAGTDAAAVPASVQPVVQPAVRPAADGALVQGDRVAGFALGATATGLGVAGAAVRRRRHDPVAAVPKGTPTPVRL